MGTDAAGLLANPGELPGCFAITPADSARISSSRVGMYFPFVVSHACVPQTAKREDAVGSGSSLPCCPDPWTLPIDYITGTYRNRLRKRREESHGHGTRKGYGGAGAPIGRSTQAGARGARRSGAATHAPNPPDEP